MVFDRDELKHFYFKEEEMFGKSCLRVIFFASVFILFFCAGSASGFKLLDGKLKIGGFIKNDSAWRLQNGQTALHGADDYGLTGTSEGLDSGDYYMCRNTLQLEASWKLLDNVTVSGIFRAFYDAALELDKDLEDNVINADAEGAIDDFERDTALRELYTDVSFGNWKLRIGKQQIVWGESDGFRMSDVINPLDYSWHYFFPSWEDIRVPLWALNANYYVPFAEDYQLSVEMVWLPGAFDNGFKGNKLAPSGTNWSSGYLTQYFHDALDAVSAVCTSHGILPIKGITNMRQLILPVLSGFHGRTGAVQYFQDSIEYSEPENDIRNSEFGLRVKALVNDWDLSLFNFYCRNDNPSFREDWLRTVITSTAREDELFEYLWVNKTGATFNFYSPRIKTVFRGECVYTMDEPFFPKNPFTVDFSRGGLPVLNCVTYESDTFAYMLGFDRPTVIEALNPTRSFFISGQMFQKFIFDFDDDMTTMDMSNDDMQTLFTLLINTGFCYDTIMPQVFMMYDVSGEGWIQPQVEYVYGSYWRFGIGANFLMSSNKKQAYFGGMRDNNDIYAWVKFGW